MKANYVLFTVVLQNTAPPPMKGERHHFVQQTGKDSCWEAEMACYGGIIRMI